MWTCTFRDGADLIRSGGLAQAYLGQRSKSSFSPRSPLEVKLTFLGTQSDENTNEAIFIELTRDSRIAPLLGGCYCCFKTES